MRRLFLVLAVCLGSASSVFAGFTATDLIVPAAGRVEGAGGSQFYTTLYISNPGEQAADVVIQLLLAGQSNAAPARFNDTIPAGATKVYENPVERLFAMKSALGALRVV